MNIKKIDLSDWVEITYSEDWEMFTQDFNMNCNLFVNKINEIIDKLNTNELKRISMFNSLYGMSVSNNLNKIENLKKEVEFFANENYKLINDISEIGRILDLEGGTIAGMTNQIRKKYFSLKKENERLNNKVEDYKSILKEAREYIEKSKLNQLDTHCKYLYIDFDTGSIEHLDELLNILDKGV